jgi:hypothetical protein
MKNAMDFLKRLFKRSCNARNKLERHAYHHLPATFQSQTPKQPVDKEKWQMCDGCRRQIPVNKDSIADSNGVVTILETCTYVCPFCSHCHVGTPTNWGLAKQEVCHSCGARISDEYQCSKCGYPRGWMQVNCPFCGNQQPVFAPHFADGCDMFTLECVECESKFYSLCIC